MGSDEYGAWKPATLGGKPYEIKVDACFAALSTDQYPEKFAEGVRSQLLKSADEELSRVILGQPIENVEQTLRDRPIIKVGDRIRLRALHARPEIGHVNVISDGIAVIGIPGYECTSTVRLDVEGRLNDASAELVADERPVVKVGQRWKTAAMIPSLGLPVKPQPRCGQTWSHFNGNTVTITDTHERADGFFRCRNKDGSRGLLSANDLLERYSYVSGPTTPETSREAFERVIRLEAEDVPDGLSKAEWMNRLLGHFEPTESGYTKKTAANARFGAAHLRKEHAERWSNWAKDASRKVPR